MYPMRLDVGVLPLPELNSHNLQRCLGSRFQKLGGSMGFLIVEWTNSYSNNCFLSLRKPKHVASYTENGDRRSVLHVLLITTQSRSESPLNVNWKKFYTHRKNH